MAVGDGIAFERAMGDLMTQVNPDNILAVHHAFRQQADDLRAKLLSTRRKTQVGLCGGDPISADAARAFNDKVGQLLDVHWRHWQELNAVADRLRETARQYGMTEEQIAASLSRDA